MSAQDAIIDKIYETAFLPGHWPKVIEALAESVGCYGGAFFSVGGRGTNYSASENCVEHLHSLLTDEWSSRNVRARNLVALKKPGFVTDHDFCTVDEIEELDIYTRFLRPRGLGWVVGTHIVGAEGDVAILSLDQRYDMGPISPKVVRFLDRLRPHIARASMLSGQLQAEKLKGSLSNLEALGIPAAVVDGQGKVKLTNQRFHGFGDQIGVRAFDAMHLTDKVANNVLVETLALLSAENDPGPRSIPVPGENDSPPFVLNVIPLRRQARDFFSNGEAIVAIVPLSSPGLAFKDIVQSLYDLTPTEARTAEALLSGRSIQEIARQNNVGAETVRSHVKQLLAKTGTSRQAELIARFSPFNPGASLKLSPCSAAVDSNGAERATAIRLT